MINVFQNAFVPLQKSLIASASMACNAVARAGLVRGATNAEALESHRSLRYFRDDGIGGMQRLLFGAGHKCGRKRVYKPADNQPSGSKTLGIDALAQIALSSRGTTIFVGRYMILGPKPNADHDGPAPEALKFIYLN